MYSRMTVRWMFSLVCAVGLLTSVAVARQAAGGNPEAAKIKNPVSATPESIAAGKKTYTEFGCGTCHTYRRSAGGTTPSDQIV